MSYFNGKYLHQYITCRAANQSIAEGDARNALIDFYHCIIHSGPAGESFEHKLEPWNKRDVESCPPPHAWGNANCNTLVRNLFLFERGDDTLYVLPALCRAWLKDGEPCGILRAPTRFGEVSVTIVPDANGATLALDAHREGERPREPYQRQYRKQRKMEIIARFTSALYFAARKCYHTAVHKGELHDFNYIGQRTGDDSRRGAQIDASQGGRQRVVCVCFRQQGRDDRLP